MSARSTGRGLPEGDVPFDANKTTCSIMNSSLDYKAILAKGEKARVEAKASRRKLKVKQGQWVGERYRNADGTLKEAFILFCGQLQLFGSAEWTEKETFFQVYSRPERRNLSLQIYRVCGSARRYDILNKNFFEGKLLSSRTISGYRASVR